MISFKTFLDEKVAKPTGGLKKACWTGYTAVGTKQKNGRTVPNCVPAKEEVELDEGANVSYNVSVSHPHFGEKQHKIEYSALSSHHAVEELQKKGFTVHKIRPTYQRTNNEEVELEELFDIIEEVVDGIAEESNIDPEILWENLEDVSDEELYETAAWRRKEGKDPKGGLNRKGIASYRRENPGSKLSMAVTGKVKRGSKAAKRRKSFCARMGGMKGAMKKPNGEPTRKALALRKWKCR